MREKYDLIVIGTSFASSFFLYKYLQHAKSNCRILVLEKGGFRSHSDQIAEQRNSDEMGFDYYRNTAIDHPWISNIMFGGNSNCWWACVPRMLPNDFECFSRYGVGKDWPIKYKDLEEYYDEAEEIMSVSGTDMSAIYPNKKPYPLPPHNLNDPDKLLQTAYPQQYFPQPTARTSKFIETRPRCCANGVCHLCPINAKFTILNGMQSIYKDPRVTLKLRSGVVRLETENDAVKGVYYETRDDLTTRSSATQTTYAQGETIALGANPIFNTQILLNSEDQSSALGKGIGEQVSFNVKVMLKGLSNYQGSTSITGQGFMFYDGEHRRHHAACIIENFNVPILRTERDRWTETMNLKFIFEDIPSKENHISLNAINNRIVDIHYQGHSEYTQKGIEAMKQRNLEKLLSALPVESVEFGELNATDAHIIGTTVMGKNPIDSVVSDDLRHHRWRNMLILGAGAFPTISPVNPTLTISALSLRSAEKLFV